MIGKWEFKTKKLIKKIENISLLRIFNQDHKWGTITINFSEPLGMNYQDLLADRLFIYEKILDERRNTEVEILSTILLMDRF